MDRERVLALLGEAVDMVEHGATRRHGAIGIEQHPLGQRALEWYGPLELLGALSRELREPTLDELFDRVMAACPSPQWVVMLQHIPAAAADEEPRERWWAYAQPDPREEPDAARALAMRVNSVQVDRDYTMVELERYLVKLYPKPKAPAELSLVR